MPLGGNIMAGGFPSTIWAVLSTPNPAAGGVPFVYSDNATVKTDVLNYWWDQINQRLSLHTNGDQTGTDSLNLYLGADSYWAYNLNSLVSGSALGASAVASYAVSSSRGTGLAPTYSLSGDFIGKFAAWSWNASSGADNWGEIAAINVYASGILSSSNMGSEMRFATKQDNGSETEWLKLTNAGNLAPMSTGLVSLGAANLGYSKLNLAYTVSSSVGAQTINNPVGSLKIAAAASSVVVTNSLVTVNSIVLAQLQSNDATALYVKSVIPAAGSFTITLNAAATGQITVAFLVINTDS
jgi:hypothetical protein